MHNACRSAAKRFCRLHKSPDFVFSRLRPDIVKSNHATLTKHYMQKAEPQFAISDRFLDQPYTLAGRLIDPVSGMLSWQGKCEHLRRKELEILALLASSDGGIGGAGLTAIV